MNISDYLCDRMYIRPCSIKGIEHPIFDRNIPIHEAGHFVVGTVLGFKMGEPVVCQDDSGFVPMERNESLKDAPLDDENPSMLKMGAVAVAATFLAGFAAESIWQGRIVLTNEVISQGLDLVSAKEALSIGGFNDGEGILSAWCVAKAILRKHWEHVIQIAESITDSPDYKTLPTLPQKMLDEIEKERAAGKLT